MTWKQLDFFFIVISRMFSTMAIKKIPDEFFLKINKSREMSSSGEVKGTFMLIYEFFSCQETVPVADSLPAREGVYTVLVRF